MEVVKELRKEDFAAVTTYAVGIKDNTIFARKNRIFEDNDERGVEYSLSPTETVIQWWEWGETIKTCSTPHIRDEEFTKEIEQAIKEADDEEKIYYLYNLLKDVVRKIAEDC